MSATPGRHAAGLLDTGPHLRFRSVCAAELAPRSVYRGVALNSNRSGRCRFAAILAVPALILAGLTAATASASADTSGCPQLADIITQLNTNLVHLADADGTTEATVENADILIAGATAQVFQKVISGPTGCPADDPDGTQQVVAAYQAEARTLKQIVSGVEEGPALAEGTQQTLTTIVNIDAPGADVKFEFRK